MIQVRPNGNTKTKVVYGDGPLRFQIPRGYSRYGLSQYKSLSISNLDPKFMEWFQELERMVYPKDNNEFKSCITECPSAFAVSVMLGGMCTRRPSNSRSGGVCFTPPLIRASVASCGNSLSRS